MANSEIRPIAIPLPQIPKGLDPLVSEFLLSYTRAVDENFRALFRATRGAGVDQELTFKEEVPALAPGASLSTDIPLLDGIEFTYDGGSGFSWTGGFLNYKGTEYVVNSGSATPALYAYLDLSGSISSPVTIRTTSTELTLQQDFWYVAIRLSSVVHAVFQSPLIHGGLIQGDTIQATSIHADTITATQLTADVITTRELDATSVYATSIELLSGGYIFGNKENYGDSDNGFWLGDDSGTYKFHIGSNSAYLKWTGTDLELKTASGFIGTVGASTFDIDGNLMEIWDTGVAGKKLTLLSGGIAVHPGTAFGTGGAVIMSTSGSVGQINFIAKSGSAGNASQLVFIGTGASIHSQTTQYGTTRAVHQNYDLDGCLVTSTVKNLAGALKYSGNKLHFHNGTSFIELAVV